MIDPKNSITETEMALLKCDFIKIRRECPRFVAYLERSLNMTMDAVCYEQGADARLKHIGAMTDLKAILSDVSNPPEGESQET